MKKPAWNRRTKRVLLIGGLLLCGALLVAACQVQEVKISYPYICSNGTPADGQSLLPNVIRCASCDDLYRLVDQGCVANGYSCQNGTPRTGTPPGNANIELCVRCESGFKLEGARCIATTYTCTGGVPVSGSPPGNRDVERCARCTIAESYPDPATGFCATEFPYICTDGSPAPGMNGTPNTERCINCNSGYHPDGDRD